MLFIKFLVQDYDHFFHPFSYTQITREWENPEVLRHQRYRGAMDGGNVRDGHFEKLFIVSHGECVSKNRDISFEHPREMTHLRCFFKINPLFWDTLRYDKLKKQAFQAEIPWS